PSRGEIAVIGQVVCAEGSARTTPPILGGERPGTLKARRVTAVPDHAQPLPDLVLAQALAADLDAADFRSDPLRLLWGEEPDDALARGLREPILRAIAGRTGAAATLGRFFVLGMPQPLDAVQRALPHLGVDALVALGLASAQGDEV